MSWGPMLGSGWSAPAVVSQQLESPPVVPSPGSVHLCAATGAAPLHHRGGGSGHPQQGGRGAGGRPAAGATSSGGAAR